MKVLVWCGLVPGHVLVETRGRRSGRRRWTVVGSNRSGDDVWVVAEQGRFAQWVRNLEADPAIRIRLRARWRPASASILDDDDARLRLDGWGRPGHARLVRRLGTALTTVHLRL